MLDQSRTHQRVDDAFGLGDDFVGFTSLKIGRTIRQRAG
jgi:hypothetical protein